MTVFCVLLFCHVGFSMAGKEENNNPLPFNMDSSMNPAGMFGFIPMPVPVFTPPVMPVRMMPPFWPPNTGSFMQQYMEAMSSGMAQVIPQSSVTRNESSTRAMSKGDATSVHVAAPVSTIAVENVSGESAQNSLTGPSKRTIAERPQFRHPMLYPTFGGFVPFAPYFPYFNMPGNGFANKQNKDSESQSTQSQQIKDFQGNDELEKKKAKEQQPPSEYGTKQEDILERKPVVKSSETPPMDSNKQEISEENSTEMDVAQILVNFMPVPIIGGVKQDKTHFSEENTDVSPIEKENQTNENVLVSTPTNVSKASNVAAVQTSLFDNAKPAKVNSVPYVATSSSKLATAKDTCGSASLIMKNATPEGLEESSKTLSSVKMPEMQPCNNNYLLNGNSAVCERFTQKHDVELSDSASSSSVILLVSSNNNYSNLTQVTQPSTETYMSVKNKSQKDIHVIEDKAVEVIETSSESQECEQRTVLNDQNVIPTVDDLLKGDLGSDKSVYKCEVCAQLFRSSLGLQKHLEFHMDDGQHYTCTICFQPFREAKSLDDHIALHMRNRPHKCTFCPKAFRDPGSLQKHVRVHTGEKPYKCTSCYQSFAEYSSLRKHLRVHTGEQPYRCQYCDKAFSISGNLQRHVLIHTGERPYKCSFCPKAFNNPSHLRRHVKNLHFKGEATTGVVEDMISAIHGEATAQVKMSLRVDHEVETEGQRMEEESVMVK